ncbi:MAG: cysteine desulfurase NifS [Candidatus Eisenbacteria sp.]|nr:cysteine desulfurase NifS [Candidatus Eisenbacteria bacterium]
MAYIYFDHNATTPLDPAVLEAMMPFLHEAHGNASSFHSPGREAREAVDLARKQVASLIGAQPAEIVFTSGGTEADNHALRGVIARVKAGAGQPPHLVTSAIEHPAVLNTAQMLEQQGCAVSYLPVDEYGRVRPEDARSAINDATALVSVMLANNEVGTIQPVAAIAAIARERKAIMHTDAVQGLGRIPVDVDALGVDLLSISAHKVYGPKGIGALYIRRGTRIAPLIYGGHQERRRRGGTENVPAIVGFGRACELAGELLAESAAREARLRDRLEQGIRERIEHVRINGHPSERLPNTLNVGFTFVEGESLLMNLDIERVAVSTGSACSSGDLQPSHVLLAMGFEAEAAHGTLRFSLGRRTTEEEIATVLDVLVRVVARVRAMSPMYRDFIKGRRPAAASKA